MGSQRRLKSPHVISKSYFRKSAVDRDLTRRNPKKNKTFTDLKFEHHENHVMAFSVYPHFDARTEAEKCNFVEISQIERFQQTTWWEKACRCFEETLIPTLLGTTHFFQVFGILAHRFLHGCERIEFNNIGGTRAKKQAAD